MTGRAEGALINIENEGWLWETTAMYASRPAHIVLDELARRRLTLLTLIRPPGAPAMRARPGALQRLYRRQNSHSVRTGTARSQRGVPIESTARAPAAAPWLPAVGAIM